MIESLDQEIRKLRSIFWSDRDPEGRVFVPLADAYRRRGDYRQAVELLREGLQRHPDFASARALSARIYLESGLVEEAAIAARRTLALDPDNLLGMEALAGALEAQDDPEAGAVRHRLEDLQGPSPAPLGPDEDEVWDIAALAPDAPAESDEEEVWDIAALAPDAPAESDGEEVWDIAALAPDAPPESDGDEVWDIAALDPDVHGETAPLEETWAALQGGAAAEPDPDEDDSTLQVDEADEPEPVITRTMAEIYARQGLTERALEVLHELLEQAPGDTGLQRRIAELESGSDDTAIEPPAPRSTDAGEGSAPEPEEDLNGHPWDAEAQQERHEVDTPFAWTDEEPDDAPASDQPSIGSYFERLLSWEKKTEEDA